MGVKTPCFGNTLAHSRNPGSRAQRRRVSLRETAGLTEASSKPIRKKAIRGRGLALGRSCGVPIMSAIARAYALRGASCTCAPRARNSRLRAGIACGRVPPAASLFWKRLGEKLYAGRSFALVRSCGVPIRSANARSCALRGAWVRSRPFSAAPCLRRLCDSFRSPFVPSF